MSASCRSPNSCSSSSEAAPASASACTQSKGYAKSQCFTGFHILSPLLHVPATNARVPPACVMNVLSAPTGMD